MLGTLYHCALHCAASNLPRFLAAPTTRALLPTSPALLARVLAAATERRAGRRALDGALAEEARLPPGAYAALLREWGERLSASEQSVVDRLGLGLAKTPWWYLGGLGVALTLFLAVAEFNTSLSALVPVINVAFLAALGLAYYFKVIAF